MSHTHTILFIEDDPSISEMVKHYLEKENYEVHCAFDGEEAVRYIEQQHFDLILLDLMLPKLSGTELLQWIRQSSTVPVMIVSAKDSDVDKALGLGFGADDYMAKPFSLIELSARVHAVLRRATRYTKEGSLDNHVITVGELSIDLTHMTVTKGDATIKLTAKEFRILELFMKHPKRVFTKEQLYRSVWREEYYGDDNVINVHMRRLREKIETDPSRPKYIQTLWGIGYRLGDFE